MKVSINLVNRISGLKLDAIGIESLTNKIGSQLGAIEDIDDWAKKYADPVVVKVVSCVKHPNADKLSLCKIDDGGSVKEIPRDTESLIQVVCGADNVAAGVWAVWLPPKSIVPSTFLSDEPFTLYSRELRGTLSHGMLASPDELDLPGGHEGILLLNEKDAHAGAKFSQLFGLNDIVFDLENKMFTHRPDCFGVMGVARELAGIQNLSFKSPTWYLNEPDFSKPEITSLPLGIQVKTDLVPRFMAVTMSGVQVQPSPLEIQSALIVSGIKPINNIVDITNYLMQITGQPLHAYDYDKLKKLSNGQPKLVARMSKATEATELLNARQLQLRDNQTVVIATDSQVIGVGGVMGGANTEVDTQTTNIVIECANFDMYSIRKTAMKYGLFTDAVTRFNKGQSPLQNDRVILKAIEMVEQLAGGRQASEVIDIKSEGVGTNPRKVSTTAQFINARLGSNLRGEEICQLLNNVEFEADTEDEDLAIKVPFWRQDIELPEDIVEEVGRLYGFSNLPIELPTAKLSVTKQDPNLEYKKLIRQLLSSAGANEILTYSFVNGQLLQKAEQNPDLAFRLANALSPALEYYRLSILPSLLSKIQPNLKAGFDQFALYELGKSHQKEQLNNNGLPAEKESLALVFAASDKAAKQLVGQPYYQAKVFLEFLLSSLDLSVEYQLINAAESKIQESQLLKPFAIERSAFIVGKSGKQLGIVGEFKTTVSQAFKLPLFVAGFELDISALQNQPKKKTYQQLPKYPKVEQDISLKVSNEITFARINTLFNDLVSQKKPKNSLLETELLDIFEKAGSKHFTFRIKLASFERTLSSQEVNSLLDEVAADLNKEVGATRI